MNFTILSINQVSKFLLLCGCYFYQYNLYSQTSFSFGILTNSNLYTQNNFGSISSNYLYNSNQKTNLMFLGSSKKSNFGLISSIQKKIKNADLGLKMYIEKYTLSVSSTRFGNTGFAGHSFVFNSISISMNYRYYVVREKKVAHFFETGIGTMRFLHFEKSLENAKQKFIPPIGLTQDDEKRMLFELREFNKYHLIVPIEYGMKVPIRNTSKSLSLHFGFNFVIDQLFEYKLGIDDLNNNLQLSTPIFLRNKYILLQYSLSKNK